MNTRILFVLSLSTVALAFYRHKIDAFSFDLGYGEFPMAYNQFGATVGLKSKMKLMPASAPRHGALFLN